MTETPLIDRLQAATADAQRDLLADASPETIVEPEVRDFIMLRTRLLVDVLEQRGDLPESFYAAVVDRRMWGSSWSDDTVRMLIAIAGHDRLPAGAMEYLQRRVGEYVANPVGHGSVYGIAEQSLPILIAAEGGLDPYDLAEVFHVFNVPTYSIIPAMEHPRLTLDAWAEIEGHRLILDDAGDLPDDVRDYDRFPPALEQLPAIEVARGINEQATRVTDVAEAMYRAFLPRLLGGDASEAIAEMLNCPLPTIRLDLIARLPDRGKGPDRGPYDDRSPRRP